MTLRPRLPLAARALAGLALISWVGPTADAQDLPADPPASTAPGASVGLIPDLPSEPFPAETPVEPAKAEAAAPAPAQASAPAAGNPTLDAFQRRAEQMGESALAWYRRTPPLDRVAWGGLAGCVILGLLVLTERTFQLRRGRVTPREFLRRFRERLQDRKVDRSKALDLCELNPSPAARVALAAVKRWGRPVADLERAVNLASRLEADRLRRNVGTFRRISAMAPLVGLLGTLIAAGRVLSSGEPGWVSSLGAALLPLTAGVAIAILSLVVYDGLVAKVEKLTGIIDRLGAETVDAIAMSAPIPDVVPTTHRPGIEPRRGPHVPIRPPLPLRVDIPENHRRDLDDPYDD